MSILEEVADGLAKRTTEIMERTGLDTIEKRMADEIGSTSPTLQETYLTAMRIRKAEARAHKLLDKYEKGDAIPKAGISSAPQEMGH
jgi:hypothetical protein